MSTRSSIIIKDRNNYTGIYCHNDSYLENVGLKLLTYYNTIDKVQELIDLGSISSLGVTLENNCQSYAEYMAIDTNQRPTNAYFRDINRYDDYNCHDEWETVKPVCGDCIDDFEQEWVYVFDVEINKWLVKSYELEDKNVYNLKEICNDAKFLNKYLDGYFITEEDKQKAIDTIINRKI